MNHPNRQPPKGEVYTVLLRSGDRDSGTLQSANFRVNWSHVLPKNTDRFVLKAYFRAHPSTTNTGEDMLFVKASGLTPCLWDSGNRGQSNIICNSVLYTSPLVEEGNIVYTYGYKSLTNDIEGVMVTRPTEEFLTVSIEDGFKAPITVNNGWFLWLQFYPIKH